MLRSSVVALALLATSASAQTNATYIDPNSVSAQLKASWCIGQESGCQNLCGGASSTQTNTCQASQLTWNCTCSNGTAPDLAAYMNTMPYFICEESYAQCITAHPNDALGQSGCKTNISDTCGTLNSSTVQAAATTSSASSTAASTASSSATSTSASASASATKNAAVVLKAVGKDYGTGIVAAVLIGAFGFLL